MRVTGEIMPAIEILARFGSAVTTGQPTSIAAWIDGAAPSRAATIEGYVQGAHGFFPAITNFNLTPTSKLEFLLGKQLPYIGIGFVNWIILTGMAVFRSSDLRWRYH